MFYVILSSICNLNVIACCSLWKYHFWGDVYLVSCNLAKLTISSTRFFVDSIGIFYVDNHVIYEKRQICFLLSNLYVFYLFSYLDLQDKTSRTMFHESGENEPSYFFLISAGEQSVFPNLIWCELQTFRSCLLSGWGSSLLFLLCSECLSRMDVEFITYFLWIYRYDHMAFCFSLLI